MADLESSLIAGTILGVVAGISSYLGNRMLLLFEKRNNIINGAYAKLLKSPDCDTKHKFYRLGAPNEDLKEYLKAISF